MTNSTYTPSVHLFVDMDGTLVTWKQAACFEELLVETIRKRYPVGCRVRLVKMDDVQAPPIGTLGTVYDVDDTGSSLVNWDDGSGLNVVYGEDIAEKV